jgi:cystathionine beta-lyase
MYALMGGYCEEGHIWVDELCQVLTENVSFACDFIEKHWEGVTVSRPQGTYMLFVDCTRWCESHCKALDEVLKACHDVGAAVQDGRPFHGSCHIRMNLALPTVRVKEAFERMDKHVFNA